MAEPICPICMEIHGRDTSQAILCPYCGRIIGCFWHPHGATKHMRECGERKPPDAEVMD